MWNLPPRPPRGWRRQATHPQRWSSRVSGPVSGHGISPDRGPSPTGRMMTPRTHLEKAADADFVRTMIIWRDNLDEKPATIWMRGRIASVAATIAIGTDGDGRREARGMAIGHSGAETLWLEFLRKPTRRGLRGVKLVIPDAHEGLKASIAPDPEGDCRATHQIDPLTTRGIAPSENEEVQMHEIERHTPSRLDDARRNEMKTPEDVTAMARLKSLGWGARRIAAELGCSKNTVKRWLREGDWRPCSTISRSNRRRRVARRGGLIRAETGPEIASSCTTTWDAIDTRDLRARPAGYWSGQPVPRAPHMPHEGMRSDRRRKKRRQIRDLAAS